MSGHSKWATTKRQKAVVDAKKGNVFTKIAKLIAVASRKGKDPVNNFSLRIAIEKARNVNMPKDNIERAIKRGSGESGEALIEELIYEGIGPSKSQFIVKCLTDNKNRTAAEIRHQFSQANGALSAVLWNFELKAVIRIAIDELRIIDKKNEFELELIDVGALDILNDPEGMTIYAEPHALQKIKQFLETKNLKTETANIEYVAKEKIELNEEEKDKIQNFTNQLDENEDVADYFTNVNI